VPLEAGRYAVRRDLAEIAVADRVFAQHYVEPMLHHLTRDSIVHRRPADDAEARGNLIAGDAFHVLDLGHEWAWGRGDNGPVGYVEVSALTRGT
jgi:hypothetical protein